MFDSWLRSGLLVLVLLMSATVLADGYVIYSSWELEWRARTEAVRTAKSLSVNAIVKPARVFGQNWYRVVAKVDSESGEHLMLDAMDKDWDVWYLSASDSSWLSDGSLANAQPQFGNDVPSTNTQDSRSDTVAPVSLVVEPLFSDDDDSPAYTLPPSTSSSAEPEDSQVVVETETDQSEPEETIPPAVEEEELPTEPNEPVASANGGGNGESDNIAASLNGSENGESDELMSSADGGGNGEPTMTVESTLREVEMIQRQAQGLISNWEQREDPTTYVLPTETDSESRQNQNLAPTRDSWFNELRIPDRRRR